MHLAQSSLNISFRVKYVTVSSVYCIMITDESTNMDVREGCDWVPYPGEGYFNPGADPGPQSPLPNHLETP